MKNVTFIIWAFVVLCAGCSSSTSVVQDEVSMTKKQLADKVKGGWAAKTIGCTYGGPVEFLHNGTMIQDYTPNKKVHTAKFSLPAFEYFPKNPSKAW